jgi:hypothetical protein
MVDFGGEQEMNMVGKYEEGVELEVAAGAEVAEGFDEEFGESGDLEDGMAPVCGKGDEEGTGLRASVLRMGLGLGVVIGGRVGPGGAGRVRHSVMIGAAGIGGESHQRGVGSCGGRTVLSPPLFLNQR